MQEEAWWKNGSGRVWQLGWRRTVDEWICNTEWEMQAQGLEGGWGRWNWTKQRTGRVLGREQRAGGMGMKESGAVLQLDF